MNSAASTTGSVTLLMSISLLVLWSLESGLLWSLGHVEPPSRRARGTVGDGEFPTADAITESDANHVLISMGLNPPR